MNKRARRHDRLREQCLSKLGEVEFHRLCAEGAAYSRQRAIDEALADA